MAEAQRPPSRSEQEARRALLHDALMDLAGSPDPQRAADEAMRALDAYIESSQPVSPAPREAPVTDYEGHREAREVRWATWLVLGGAVLSTVIVAILLSGGWPAGLAIIAIWAVALLVLAQT